MATCKSCRARIIWAETAAGRKIPLDPGMYENGNIVMSGTPTRPVAEVVEAGKGQFRAHFVSCPNADEHRKPRQPATHWSDDR